MAAFTSFASQSPAPTFATISSTTTISQSAGNYIFNLAGIDTAGGYLDAGRPRGSSFVLNIAGTFHLSPGSILLSGGLTANDVIYNVLGAGNLNFSGGGNASVVDGVILAPNRDVNETPGLVNGAIIANSINLASGASVIGQPRR